MSISCDCGGGDYDWWYIPPLDYSILETNQRRRCFSCRGLIDLGADVGKFTNWRSPRDDIELRIYDEDGEIYMADTYMCETCIGLFWSMTELGFCISLDKGERMADLAKLSQTGEY
jgi:hypothetical protein